MSRQKRLYAYESLKALWVRQNPSATPAKYEAAMRAIAARCGI